jgi:hypothetical protein
MTQNVGMDEILRAARDPSRASRKATKTDSLGRPRVPRTYHRRRIANANGAKEALATPSPSSTQTSDLTPAPIS